MPKPPHRTAPEARLADVELPPVDASVHIWPGEQVGGLHVRATPGAGTEPALFVHGLGGSSHNWTDLAGVLRDHLDVEAIDLPGHGRSGPAETYSLQAHADAVIGHLEKSGRGPVHLAGNSMGGAISVLVAAQRPHLVRTLTLISPAVPDNRIRAFPLRTDPLSALLVVRGLGESIARRYNQKVPVERRMQRTIDLVFGDPSRYPAERMAESVEEVRARDAMPWAVPAMLRSMRGLAAAQFVRNRVGWRTLAEITVPTLVLWGDRDRLVAPDLAPYVAAAIPSSRVLVLPGIGHTAMMEDPATTARAMLALVADSAEIAS